jgi:hypothetical protein
MFGICFVEDDSPIPSEAERAEAEAAPVSEEELCENLAHIYGLINGLQRDLNAVTQVQFNREIISVSEQRQRAVTHLATVMQNISYAAGILARLTEDVVLGDEDEELT